MVQFEFIFSFITVVIMNEVDNIQIPYRLRVEGRNMKVHHPQAVVFPIIPEVIVIELE